MAFDNELAEAQYLGNRPTNHHGHAAQDQLANSQETAATGHQDLLCKSGPLLLNKKRNEINSNTSGRDDALDTGNG